MNESDLPPDSAFDDDAAEMLLRGQLSGDDPLAAVLAALRATAERPVPEPSAALAKLLESGQPFDELARRRRRRIVAGAVVVGATSLTLSGVAAAHDALPGPAQSVVRGIINAITPSDIDAPHRGPSQPGPPATHAPQ